MNLEHFKKLDWVLIVCSVLITCFGLAAIWSTGLAKNNFINFEKQIGFFAAGFVLMIAVSFFDYRILRNNSYLILIIYITSLILLIGTFFFTPTVRGIRAWYRFGPFSFDPLELAKIILIIILAKYFSLRHVEMYRIRHILLSGLYVFLMLVLILPRPELGGAAILTMVWLGILMVSGIKMKHFLILLLCFVVIAGLAWLFLLQDYQKDRITAFIFPRDLLGQSWSQNQAKIAIGSGGIFGQGLGKGSQVQYGFLPEPHTDFIFSVIAEEWGLAGIFVLFLLYLTLIWRIVKIAIQAQFNFPRLFSVGLAIVLVSHFLINVGMNLSLLPVVGIYLPFVSYGGSALIANFFALGILQSIRTHS